MEAVASCTNRRLAGYSQGVRGSARLLFGFCFTQGLGTWNSLFCLLFWPLLNAFSFFGSNKHLKL